MWTYDLLAGTALLDSSEAEFHLHLIFELYQAEPE